MSKRFVSSAVVLAMVAAGSLAGFISRPSPASGPASPGPSAASLEPTSRGDLPPNHPAISAGRGPSHPAFAAGPSGDNAAITWSVPPAWVTQPNPSTMRIATYRVPRVRIDGEDAELSVTRTGGSTEANIQRWIGQFDGASTETQTERTVQELRVTVVSIAGRFMGGGMMQEAPSSPRSSWALLGAIVETPGSSYFFKLVGPASTVDAARPSFEAMIGALKKA